MRVPCAARAAVAAAARPRVEHRRVRKRRVALELEGAARAAVATWPPGGRQPVGLVLDAAAEPVVARVAGLSAVAPLSAAARPSRDKARVDRDGPEEVQQRAAPPAVAAGAGGTTVAGHALGVAEAGLAAAPWRGRGRPRAGAAVPLH